MRSEAEELGLTAEEDDGELGFAVLEREVDVAGGGGAAVGDLALDPDVGVGALSVLADVGDEGADGVDAAFLLNGKDGGRGRNAGILRCAQKDGFSRFWLWCGFGGGEEVGLGGAASFQLGAGFAAQAGQGVGWVRVLSGGHPEGSLAFREWAGAFARGAKNPLIAM